MSDRPKVGAYDDDDMAERTAVVTLSSLRGGGSRREVKDRYLLIRARGAQLGHVTRLGAEPVRIGRSQDCEIWLSDDGVSRKHGHEPDICANVYKSTAGAEDVAQRQLRTEIVVPPAEVDVALDRIGQV